MKVINIELKQDKNGNPLKVVGFEDGRKVWVNSKYDSPIYDQVLVGSDWEVIKEGDFNKIRYDKAPRGATGIKEAQARKEQSISKFADRKEESIALAGAQRDAVLIVTSLYSELDSLPTEDKAEAIKKEILYWHNWLLNDLNHKDPASSPINPF